MAPSFAALGVLVAAAVAVQAAVPSPGSLKSSVTFIYQNDLDWTTAASKVSGLLLESRTNKQAVTACAALGEGLFVFDGAQAKADIKHQLAYQVSLGTFDSSQELWISNSASGGCRTVDSLGTVRSSTCNRSLPVLCSNSAPFRTTDQQDTSVQFQASVTTAKKQTFTGYRDHTSFRFMGIRYGNTPARWTDATLFKSNQTAFDATQKGSQCPQSGGGSEDCLFLNIWTPFLPKAGDTLKPVMFHLHGGAYTSGSANDGTFDGGNFASREDVVIVDTNYRLSTIGFLALADNKTNGNFGISDQVTALTWVNQNIAAFGGDPSRITIFGQSAGASSVRVLMGSPKAIGLFHAAIPMSNLAGENFGTIFSNYLTIEQEVQQAANPILQATGCSTAADQLACLKAIDAETLVNLGNGNTVARFPVVDGNFIPDVTLPVTGNGPIANVPVLMGMMRDDGAPFITFPLTTNVTHEISQVLFGTPSAASVAQSGLFNPPNIANKTLAVFNVTARITTDVEFRCLDQAGVFSAVKRGLFPNLWYYQFDRSYQTPGFNPNAPTCTPPVDADHPLGDTTKEYFHCHSGELFYVWGTLGQFQLPFRDALDLPFSQLAMDIWGAFAWNHNPNPDTDLLKIRGYTSTLSQLAHAPAWKPVTPKNLKLRVLNTPIGQSAFQESKQCTFLGLPIDFYERNLTIPNT